MEKKVTPEKRMELARYIREENLGNRWKLRQRENILYGRENEPPPYEKGLFPETGETAPLSGAGGTFKYRMTLAVLLFVGFLLCDTNQSKILTFSTDDVYKMILADSFHLYDGEENAVMEELAELFD